MFAFVGRTNNLKDLKVGPGPVLSFYEIKNPVDALLDQINGGSESSELCPVACSVLFRFLSYEINYG